MNRHVEAVHKKAKIPCPVANCRYSKDGSRGGISRKDALKRHLASHGLTSDALLNKPSDGTTEPQTSPNLPTWT